MIRITAFAGALLCLFATPLSAAGLHPRCNIGWPCQTSVVRNFRLTQAIDRTQTFALMRENPVIRISKREARRLARGQQLYRAMPFGMPVIDPPGRHSGLVAPLASKLANIQSACPGTVAISGVRHTYVAGTRRISLHASGKAVDVRGNYRCIYAQLQGWPGGYSTDAGRVHHVHISIGGREDGIRFAHGGHRHHRHRYASR